MKNNIKKKDKNPYLRKHVDVVLCENKMSLVQRKVFNVLLYKAMPKLLEEEWHQVSLTGLMELIGYKSRNYTLLVDHINSLSSLSLQCKIVDSKTRAKDVISASSNIISNIFIKEGYIHYNYNSFIRERLFYPGIYAQIDLKLQSLLKSSYGLVLYELCEKYKGVGQTEWIELPILTKLMGVKEKAYKKYSDIEKNVVKKAIKDVTCFTNFEVDFKKQKEGRTVTGIKFLIEKKEAIQDVLLESDTDLLDFLVKEVKFKPRSSAESFIQKYGAEKIQEQINIIKNTTLYKSGKIRNMAAVIRDAVTKEGGYDDVKSSEKIIIEQQAEKVKKEAKSKKEEASKNALNKEYLKYTKKCVNEYIEKLNDSEEKSLGEKFVAYCLELGFVEVVKKAKKGNFDSVLVRPIFNKWVVDNYLSDVVLSKEEFVESN